MLVEAQAGIAPRVQTIDLQRIVEKLIREQDAWGVERAEKAEREYRRFLTLRLKHGDERLVPTKDADKIWHGHILDTRAYAQDMEALFGTFLHHEPRFGNDADSMAVMAESLARTKILYEQQFGEPMPIGARCEGKPCHAPTSCRCR